MRNNVQRLRETLLLSKAELARRAGLSTLTIDRVEKGRSCRMETKRKIIIALGFNLADKDVVFGLREPDQKSLAEAATRLTEWSDRQEDEKDMVEEMETAMEARGKRDKASHPSAMNPKVTQ